MLEPYWHSLSSALHNSVPYPQRDWLLDMGSLTQRLLDASSYQLKVELLKHTWERPRFSEAAILGLPSRRWALVREVVLRGKGTPWVYARSILPTTTLTGAERALARLNTKPLGAFLFSQSTMYRGPIEIAYHQEAPGYLDLDGPIWGRRSVFYLHNKPLLVSEHFLPGFWSDCGD